MRNGIINITDQSGTWRWAQKHYQLCRRNYETTFDQTFTSTLLVYNGMILPLYYMVGTVLLPTNPPQYTVIGRTITIDISNTVVTLTPYDNSAYSSTIYGYYVNNGVLDQFALSSITSNAKITQWTTNQRLHCLIRDSNNQWVDTGYGADLTYINNNRWTITNGNIPFIFHGFDLHIVFLVGNAATPPQDTQCVVTAHLTLL